MEHSLRVLVRVDTARATAAIEVRGCLTADTYPSLLNILQHTATLGAVMAVNLLRARHIEAEALRALLDLTAARLDGPTTAGVPAGIPASVEVPAALPACAPRALTNEEALERAFLLRDPGVLLPAAGRQAPGRPRRKKNRPAAGRG